MLSSESSSKELLYLLLVQLFASRCDRARWVASGVIRILPFMVFRLIRRSKNARAYVGPCPVIQRLLLTPENIGIRVFVKVGREHVVREWRNLLQSADGNVFDALLLSFLKQGIINLACAQDVTANVIRSYEIFMRFRQVALEVGISNHFIKRRSSVRVPQKRFREEYNKRLPEISVILTTQNVEIVGWSCRINDLHVAVLVLPLNLLRSGENVRMIVAELQKPLYASA